MRANGWAKRMRVLTHTLGSSAFASPPRAFPLVASMAK